MMLCAFMLNISAVNARTITTGGTSCECCKNCKDEKCKELCKKWSEMSADERKSDEGKKVKEECTKICNEKCKEQKCCSSEGSSSSCQSMMEGKDCCKKKK